MATGEAMFMKGMMYELFFKEKEKEHVSPDADIKRERKRGQKTTEQKKGMQCVF